MGVGSKQLAVGNSVIPHRSSHTIPSHLSAYGGAGQAFSHTIPSKAGQAYNLSRRNEVKTDQPFIVVIIQVSEHRTQHIEVRSE